MKIFVNQIGYERTGKKRAVIEAPVDFGLKEFKLADEESGETVFKVSAMGLGCWAIGGPYLNKMYINNLIKKIKFNRIEFI